jgi:hypothetical protein
MASKSSAAARSQAKSEVVAPKRNPTVKERQAIEAARTRREERAPRVAVAITREGEAVKVETPHADAVGWGEALIDAMGTTSYDFAETVLAQIMDVMDPRADRPKAYNAALAVMGAIAPRDELEAQLAGQIIATHHLALDSMGRAARSDTIPKRDAYITQATKLGRTAVAQVEALAKLRGGGKQQVEVRHVYVNGNAVIGPGAQAVFGDARGGGGCGENVNRPHAQGLEHLPGAPVAKVRGEDAGGGQMPIAVGERSDPLSKPRRD